MGFAFLSHRSVDKPRIREFVLRLMREELPAWIDDPLALNLGSDFDGHIASIERGRDWPTQIDRALAMASVIIVFWSCQWDGRGAFLGQEYAMALNRHRTGQALYLPVFLDDPATFPEEVKRLRADLHDDVQGINVARAGAEGWELLLRDLRKALGAPAPVGVPPARAPRAIDWTRLLGDPPRDPNLVGPLLLALPEGPPVDAYKVGAAARNRMLDAIDELSAAAAVGEANAVVMTTFGVDDDDKYAYLIMRGTVPNPNSVPLQHYWYAVIDRACFLGPRMLAALLLALPPRALRGCEHALGGLLSQLQGDGR